jgi:hypothetical protein
MKLIEHIFGVPMAAPETAKLKHLRLSTITLCSVTVICLLGVEKLIAWNRTVSGVGLFALLLVTTCVGGLYLYCKNSADNAYLDGFKSSTEAGSPQ